MKQRRCKRRGCPKPLKKRRTEGQHRWANREYCSNDCRLLVHKLQMPSRLEAGL